MEQQISLDDFRRLSYLAGQPGRSAFIHEWGDFGFNFAEAGTSEFYLICAVIIKNEKIPELEAALDNIALNGFNNAKSSEDIHQQRMKAVKELLRLEYHMVLLLADKKRFYKDSPLANYKESFIKFLHNRLYQNLYFAYPKLRIIEDKSRWTKLQESFKAYALGKQTEINLFDEYDFDFLPVGDSILSRMAAFITDTLGSRLSDMAAPDYFSIFKPRILHIERFPGDTSVHLDPAMDNSRYDEEITSIAIRRASAYIKTYESSEELERQLQVRFLKYLLYEAQYNNPYRFITSREIILVLSATSDFPINRDYLYRKIVAPLRDNKVLLASCAQGYKIPISYDDLAHYLQQTNSIVSPMLHRMGICREVVLQQTDGKLDILDNDEFKKYKKYFE